MALSLPRPIATYFDADQRDGEAVSRCFTENAVVKDEGETHRGRAAISRWKANASTKYRYTSRPLAFEHEDGKIIVIIRLTGQFPGSLIDVRYFFALEGDKIASLEIVP
jgi:hypothetical protein